VDTDRYGSYLVRVFRRPQPPSGAPHVIVEAIQSGLVVELRGDDASRLVAEITRALERGDGPVGPAAARVSGGGPTRA